MKQLIKRIANLEAKRNSRNIKYTGFYCVSDDDKESHDANLVKKGWRKLWGNEWFSAWQEPEQKQDKAG